MCTHECTVHIHVHACRGQRRTSDVHLSPSWLLRHSLCTWSLFGLDWMARKLPGFSCLWFPSFSSTGVTVLHMIMPGFFCRCWGFELGSSYLHNDCSTQWGIIFQASRASFYFYNKHLQEFPIHTARGHQVVWSSSYLTKGIIWGWYLRLTSDFHVYLHIPAREYIHTCTHVNIHTHIQYRISKCVKASHNKKLQEAQNLSGLEKNKTAIFKYVFIKAVIIFVCMMRQFRSF